MSKLLYNVFGVSISGSALFLNVKAWLFQIDVNQFITITLGFLSIIYLGQKMYDQYLISKIRKAKNE